MAAPTGTMRAIRVFEFGGPDVLKLVEDQPIPVPAKGEVLLQVKAIGVNPSDLYTRARGQGTVQLPFIPGYDAAGVVAGFGSDVTKFKIGERVYVALARGAYAEFMVSDARRVHHLADHLTFSQGAAIGVPYFTSVRALKHKANVKPSDKVLVHGASGGTGLAAVQIAKSWGLDVVGTASTDEGAALVKAAGARLVLNHKDPNHEQNLKDATGGKGFDVILEMLASNVPLDVRVAATFGRIVVIGPGGGIPHIDPGPLILKEIAIVGLIQHLATDEEREETAKLLEDGIQKKITDPVIDQEFPLKRASQAHEAIASHTGGSKGKIIILP
ncbi:Zeta-crystallin [Hypsibius exemplaris]|uniref:Zeta-crystallin n=1 Tax=Hypsibius exemplaris TaxID=2072580 RepID=A0A1W0WC06_HYPEX|nr:Zeta-crystallin [Hypsibius exemplaris]